MSRTNIDIDDDLIRTVMEQNGLSTKRAAVDLALRRLVRHRPSAQDLLALEGIGTAMTNDEVERLSRPSP